MKFHRSVIALVVVLASAALAFGAEGNWTVARYDEGQTGFTPQKIELPLTVCWEFNTAKFDDNPSVPAVVDGVVYFASGNRVYAVDAETGAMKWRYPSTERLNFNIKTGITVWENLVFFGGTDGNVYALDAEQNGRIVWRYPTSGPVRSTPVVSDQTLFVGSDDNSLYAIDARSGVLSWDGGFRTRDDISAAPAISPGVVVFQSMDANIYAANTASGRIRWSFQLPVSPVRSAPIFAGNNIFLNAGNTIYGLNSKNGQIRYALQLPSDVCAPLAIAENTIVAVCRNKKMYAYEVTPAGVRSKWEAPAEIGASVIAAPTIAGDLIFVGCTKGMINAYSLETGQLMWSYIIAPALAGESNMQKADFTDIAAPVVVSNGSLFVLTDDGTLHCFRNSAADNTPPSIIAPMPAIGSAMSGQPPIPVSAIIYDDSTGVDPKSIELWLDDQQVPHEFDPTTLKLTYETPITQPLISLRDGRHFLKIVAKDWKGNTQTYTWSFVVDNTLPPRIPASKLREATKGTSKSNNDRRQPPKPPTGPSNPGIPGGPTGPGGPGPGGPGGPGAPPDVPDGFNGPPPSVPQRP